MNFNLISMAIGLASQLFTAFSHGATTVQPLSDDGKEERDFVAKFYTDHPAATPEEGHYAWVSYKEGQGWTRGDVYDAVNKKHPSLVVWEELPQNLKLKNSMTQQAVATIVSLLPVSDEVKTTLNAVEGVAETVVHAYSGGDSN